jgi:hypothetical protein
MPRAKISYLACMRRELGLPTGSVRSVLDPPMVEESSTIASVQKYCCLVIPVLPSWENKENTDKMEKILELLKTPHLDYRDLRDDLVKCCKKGWTNMPKLSVFVERSTIIHGIKLRAKGNFPDNPTYEQQQRKELDKILENNLRRLFYSIWRTENRF